MSARTLRASPLAIVLTLVIAAAAVLGFAFTKHSRDQQEQVLLQSDANQAALYAGSAFSGVGGLLDSLATGVALSNGDPQVFVQRAAPLAKAAALSFVLAQRQGSGYVVEAAAGPGFHQGDALGAPLSGVLASAGAQLTAAPVHYDGRTSTAGFAVGPPLVPAGFAVYMQVSIDPFLRTPATTS
ncbi:MAG: hypothetical protein ACREOE_01785 [Gemmatimonadales bacterium]